MQRKVRRALQQREVNAPGALKQRRGSIQPQCAVGTSALLTPLHAAAAANPTRTAGAGARGGCSFVELEEVSMAGVGADEGVGAAGRTCRWRHTLPAGESAVLVESMNSCRCQPRTIGATTVNHHLHSPRGRCGNCFNESGGPLRLLRCCRVGRVAPNGRRGGRREQPRRKPCSSSISPLPPFP